MITESFNTQPLATVMPSYLYYEYSNDDDLQAFVASYNEIAQGYIDWFNSTPLAVYTLSSISGQLLDWIANGIYGISRPYLSTVTQSTYGATDSVATNKLATNKRKIVRSGTTSIVNDDIYKRILTWHTYRGDGYQMSLPWLRKRVARFIYGVNGADIPVGDIYNISVQTPPYTPAGALNTVAMNTLAMNGFYTRNYEVKHAIQITVPNNSIGQAFQILLQENYLAVPFQIKFSVILA